MIVEEIIRCKLLPLNEAVLVYKEGSVSTVPFDSNNLDYAVYQQWIQNGNIPEPADILS